jgi:hypothetical protein
MCVTYRFRFRADGAATIVDMEGLVEGNLLWKLFLGMLCRVIEKEDGEYLNRLKAAVEGTPASVAAT